MKNYLTFLTLFSLTSLTHIYSQDTTVSVVIQPKKDQSMPNQQMLHYKSPSDAFLLSVGSTVLPIVIGKFMYQRRSDEDGFNWLIVIAGGSLIGPSMGNFYAGDTKRGIKGILFRGGGELMITMGLFQKLNESNVIEDDEGDFGSYGSDGDALIYGGLAVIGISAVWNIVTAPASAREYNSKHGLSFSPILDPVNNKAGMNFSYKF